MTGIATNTKLTGGKPIVTIDELLESPALKGKVTMLTEMADSIAVVMLANGDDPTKVDDASFTKAIDRIQKAVDSGQIRQFTGNDYTGPLSKGDLAAALSWSGDVVQLTLDNKNLEWNLPETGGAIWTDNMLIPKGGDVFTASTYMNFVYEPGDRRADRGVHQLRLAGEGREGGDGEARPGPCFQPARLPGRRHALEGGHLRLEGALERGLHRAVAGADRQLTEWDILHRHRGLVPYLLLAPGLAWLAVFFVVPLGILAYQSLQSGSFDFGYAFDWSFGNYWEAIDRYHEHLLRSLHLRRAGDGDRAGRQLPARVLDRLPRRPLEEPLPARDHRAVLRHLPDPDARVAVDPLRQRVRPRRPAHRRASSRTAAGCSRHPIAVVAGLTYNFLPFMALPLYVALEQIDARLLEAAQDLYASKVKAFLRVTLPLSLPGVFAGTLLTFIPAAGDFINAQLLGTPREHMIGNVIQSKFLELIDYPAAAALSFVLMAAIVGARRGLRPVARDGEADRMTAVVRRHALTATRWSRSRTCCCRSRS